MKFSILVALIYKYIFIRKVYFHTEFQPVYQFSLVKFGCMKEKISQSIIYQGSIRKDTTGEEKKERKKEKKQKNNTIRVIVKIAGILTLKSL